MLLLLLHFVHRFGQHQGEVVEGGHHILLFGDGVVEVAGTVIIVDLLLRLPDVRQNLLLGVVDLGDLLADKRLHRLLPFGDGRDAVLNLAEVLLQGELIPQHLLDLRILQAQCGKLFHQFFLLEGGLHNVFQYSPYGLHILGVALVHALLEAFPHLLLHLLHLFPGLLLVRGRLLGLLLLQLLLGLLHFLPDAVFQCFLVGELERLLQFFVQFPQLLRILHQLVEILLELLLLPFDGLVVRLVPGRLLGQFQLLSGQLLRLLQPILHFLLHLQPLEEGQVHVQLLVQLLRRHPDLLQRLVQLILVYLLFHHPLELHHGLLHLVREKLVHPLLQLLLLLQDFIGDAFVLVLQLLLPLLRLNGVFGLLFQLLPLLEQRLQLLFLLPAGLFLPHHLLFQRFDALQQPVVLLHHLREPLLGLLFHLFRLLPDFLGGGQLEGHFAGAAPFAAVHPVVVPNLKVVMQAFPQREGERLRIKIEIERLGGGVGLEGDGGGGSGTHRVLPVHDITDKLEFPESVIVADAALEIEAVEIERILAPLHADFRVGVGNHTDNVLQGVAVAQVAVAAGDLVGEVAVGLHAVAAPVLRAGDADLLRAGDHLHLVGVGGVEFPGDAGALRHGDVAVVVDSFRNFVQVGRIIQRDAEMQQVGLGQHLDAVFRRLHLLAFKTEAGVAAQPFQPVAEFHGGDPFHPVADPVRVHKGLLGRLFPPDPHGDGQVLVLKQLRNGVFPFKLVGGRFFVGGLVVDDPLGRAGEELAVPAQQEQDEQGGHCGIFQVAQVFAEVDGLVEGEGFHLGDAPVNGGIQQSVSGRVLLRKFVQLQRVQQLVVDFREVLSDQARRLFVAEPLQPAGLAEERQQDHSGEHPGVQQQESIEEAGADGGVAVGEIFEERNCQEERQQDGGKEDAAAYRNVVVVLADKQFQFSNQFVFVFFHAFCLI